MRVWLKIESGHTRKVKVEGDTISDVMITVAEIFEDPRIQNYHAFGLNGREFQPHFLIADVLNAGYGDTVQTPLLLQSKKKGMLIYTALIYVL